MPRETGTIVLRLIFFLSAFADTVLTAMMNDVKVLRVLVKVLRAKNESTLDVVQKVCEYFQSCIQRLVPICLFTSFRGLLEYIYIIHS